MTGIYFFNKNKNYKKGRLYDYPTSGDYIIYFEDADFVLRVLNCTLDSSSSAKWVDVSKQQFMDIRNILSEWRYCFDSFDFRGYEELSWYGLPCYHPNIKTKLDEYISKMDNIYKGFDWDDMEMIARIYFN